MEKRGPLLAYKIFQKTFNNKDNNNGVSGVNGIDGAHIMVRQGIARESGCKAVIYLGGG